MNRHIFISITMLFFACNAIAQNQGSFVDQRDSKTYKTIKIGNQTWMAENLDAAQFMNGDPIPQAKNAEDWVKAGNEAKPVWANFDFNPENGKTYGKLYNWYAVNDKRGLAPEGWRIPTFNDWNELAMSLGGELVAGGKMKSTAGWEKEGNGTNSSGFSALPGGFGFSGFFDFKDGHGFWWSMTAENENQARVFQLVFANDHLLSYPFDKKNAYSVRCIKN